jgi:hypothetical protein
MKQTNTSKHSRFKPRCENEVTLHNISHQAQLFFFVLTRYSPRVKPDLSLDDAGAQVPWNEDAGIVARKQSA